MQIYIYVTEQTLMPINTRGQRYVSSSTKMARRRSSYVERSRMRLVKSCRWCPQTLQRFAASVVGRIAGQLLRGPTIYLYSPLPPIFW